MLVVAQRKSESKSSDLWWPFLQCASDIPSKFHSRLNMLFYHKMCLNRYHDGECTSSILNFKRFYLERSGDIPPRRKRGRANVWARDGTKRLYKSVQCKGSQSNTFASEFENLKISQSQSPDCTHWHQCEQNRILVIGKKVVYIFTLRNLKYMYKNVCMDQNSM